MRQQIPNLLRLKSMASPFEQLSSRMDALTASRFGKTIEINGNPCTVVEFHYLAEMGELSGDAIRLVVFTSSYRPRRNDQVVTSAAVVVQSSYGAERRGQLAVNMANEAFFRFCNSASESATTHPWKQLVSQFDPLVTVGKLFVTSDKNELIRLKTTSKQNYIIGIASDNSAMWYMGNASDSNNNVYLNNYKGSNSVAMFDDGNIELKTKDSNGTIYANGTKVVITRAIGGNKSLTVGVIAPEESATINIWGTAGSRPTVMEFSIPSGYFGYFQKNIDGSRALSVNGGVVATAFTQSSDIELKENVTAIEDALGKLSKLNGYTYTWKEGGAPSAGVIAQEVIEVLPEIISTVRLGESHQTVIDEDGEERRIEIDQSTQKRYYAVEYSGLIGLLVAGINEERQMREVLESEISNLSERLMFLEKKFRPL